MSYPKLEGASESRFWAKVEKHEDADGCWEWTASRCRGYGYFQLAGTGRVAHRLSYEALVGPIREGMFLDHICHNKGCVNPDHLRQVTNKQNLENLTGAYCSSSSGVRGVSRSSDGKKWQVEVTHNTRKHYGGLFDTLEEAAEAARNLRNSLYSHNDADRVVAA